MQLNLRQAAGKLLLSTVLYTIPALECIADFQAIAAVANKSQDAIMTILDHANADVTKFDVQLWDQDQKSAHTRGVDTNAQADEGSPFENIDTDSWNKMPW